MTKKKERGVKLIALHNMISHQKRCKDGSAKFNKGQLDAAMKVIEEVLGLDNIFAANSEHKESKV